jgi:hypothetical protein
VLAVIDDLQWADGPSARALLFAVRRLQADRVLVVVSARPGELARLGEGWLRFLAGDHRAGRVRLGGLEPEEVVEMIAWAGRCLWLAARTVIRAVKMAHHEQVRMWECVLLTSGAAPLTAAGPLRWVPSLGGDRLVGSYLPAQDPSETGGDPGWACSGR